MMWLPGLFGFAALIAVMIWLEGKNWDFPKRLGITVLIMIPVILIMGASLAYLGHR